MMHVDQRMVDGMAWRTVLVQIEQTEDLIAREVAHAVEPSPLLTPQASIRAQVSPMPIQKNIEIKFQNQNQIQM